MVLLRIGIAASSRRSTPMNPTIDPSWYCPGCNRLTCRCNDYLDEDSADFDDEPDGIGYDPTGIGSEQVGLHSGTNLWPNEDDGLPF